MITRRTSEDRYKNCEWQYFGDDQWVFGEKVRGLIRVRQGEMYFDPDQESREGGWIWMARALGETETRRGFAPNLQTAARWVEEALGITTMTARRTST